MDLSILLPAKRDYNWVKLYNSIDKSFSGEWELIIVTTKELPEGLLGKTNIKLLYSQQSPLQKRQMALNYADGKYISWMADDSVLLPGEFDNAFKMLEGKDYKHLVVLKYLEGESQKMGSNQEIYPTTHDFMKSDEYYCLDTHYHSIATYAPKGLPLLCNAILTRQVMWEIGGFDSVFQTDPMAYNDLAIRLSKIGSTYDIYPEITQITGHMPGTTGDHAAIHYAQTEDDEPLFKAMYHNKKSLDRIKIPLDNWKNADKVWKAREKWG